MRLKKHVLLVPTTVPVTTRTYKNIQKRIIHFHHYPFLHPLDKFVELFKPNIVILMATQQCSNLNFLLWDNGEHQCVQITTTTYAMFVTKDSTTMILFTIASSSKVLIHNSFIFLDCGFDTSTQQVRPCCQVIVVGNSSGNHNNNNNKEHQQNQLWKTKKESLLFQPFCVCHIWQSFPQQSRYTKVVSSI